jgi:hypothetical protein
LRQGRAIDLGHAGEGRLVQARAVDQGLQALPEAGCGVGGVHETIRSFRFVYNYPSKRQTRFEC